MDFLNAAVRFLVEGYAGLFSGLHPLVGLLPLSVLVGLGMLWVFGKTSDQKAISRQKKQVQAFLLELRLFGDDPALLWRSQIDLVRGNLRYMALMLKPALFLTLPMVVLLFHLDAVYGIAALAPGQSAVVTVQTSGRLAESAESPTLSVPEGFVLETDALRALESGQFSWRVSAAGPESGPLRFAWQGQSWEKSLRVGEPFSYVSYRRTASAVQSLFTPGEALLESPRLEWVEVAYPPAEIEFGSYRMHWLVWFLIVSLVAAYALKGFFRVTI